MSYPMYSDYPYYDTFASFFASYVFYILLFDDNMVHF